MDDVSDMYYFSRRKECTALTIQMKLSLKGLVCLLLKVKRHNLLDELIWLMNLEGFTIGDP